MRLKNKVALLTGVGERSSRATAVLFAKEGAKVAIAARRAETLAATAEMIKNIGGEVITVQGDGTLEEDTQRMVAETAEAFGRLDILYNNVSGAFASQGQRLHEMPTEDWQAVLDAILNSAYLLSKAALPVMLEQGQGAIIFVSASENVQLMGNPAYGAGKAGVIQLTKNMAREYRQDQIRVNGIAPGFMQLIPWQQGQVKTSADHLFRDPDRGKRQGLSEDIAFAAAYLASDEANWITGQTLVLDGGDDIMPRHPVPPPR